MKTSTIRSHTETIRLIHEYADEHSALPPLSSADPEVYRLAIAVKNFRARQKPGLGDAQLISLLEAIPGWQWSLRDVTPTPAAGHERRWSANLEAVQNFIKKHGHIPRGTPSAPEAEMRLGSWCQTQRNNRTSTTTPLTPQRFKRLGQLDGWFWDRPETGVVWASRLEDLKTFVDENGRLPRRNADSRTEASLADWIRSQRAKGRSAVYPPLTASQRKQLEAIEGWAWEGQTGRSFESRVLELKMHLTKTGGVMPGEATVLGRFVASQRQQYAVEKMQTLTPERVDALECVPGWMWTFDYDNSWLSRYMDVLDYVEEHGRLPSMKSADPAVRRLGRWTDVMRRSIVPGSTTMSLTIPRRRALERIPGWFWVGEGARPRRSAELPRMAAA